MFNVTEVLKSFDESVHSTLQDIISTPINKSSWKQCVLPVNLGGLGLQSAEMIHDIAFFSSNPNITQAFTFFRQSNSGFFF